MLLGRSGRRRSAAAQRRRDNRRTVRIRRVGQPRPECRVVRRLRPLRRTQRWRVSLLRARGRPLPDRRVGCAARREAVRTRLRGDRLCGKRAQTAADDSVAARCGRHARQLCAAPRRRPSPPREESRRDRFLARRSHSTACASSCGATYGPPRRSTGGRSPASTVTTSISRRPFSRRDVATTSAIRYSSSTSRPEPTPTAGSKRSKPTTAKWAGRLPLGVEPLDGARLADLDRRAEAYFLKLLCQKRLFGACPFRRIVRYIRTYPGRAASWALPFKYLKYHLKSLVRHG